MICEMCRDGQCVQCQPGWDGCDCNHETRLSDYPPTAEMVGDDLREALL